ncbi:MAG: CRISPR-associated CARF protein Csa3 [Metallosphaera prunae]|uniref:CRISPR-associated CARF protein Csa3 n=1 Tax=Metallosphaera prunae TaxID=47304 RepID=UPI0022728835|nr:CRISPR-associated CARF protein Csa3 [Metallosphaera prunae]MCY0862920.1 CRISPR-associated CARF protein Csa3 [Metallosphaera prunae]
MTCLITPIGFDEKFIVRSFLRHGKSRIQEVLLVKPSAKNEKTEIAISNLMKLLSEASTPLQTLEINHDDFFSSVSRIMSWVKRSTHSDYLLNLSSGMRIVDLEILTAFLLLQIDAEVEVETETLQGLVTFRVKDLIPYQLEESDLKILRAIHLGENKVSEISRKMKLPLATTWRRVKELQTAGFVTQDADGLKLTQKGRIFANLNFS